MIARLVDKSNSARHVSVEDVLASACETQAREKYKKVVVIFCETETNTDVIEWHVAGMSSRERKGLMIEVIDHMNRQ